MDPAVLEDQPRLAILGDRSAQPGPEDPLLPQPLVPRPLPLVPADQRFLPDRRLRPALAVPGRLQVQRDQWLQLVPADLQARWPWSALAAPEGP